MHALVQALTVLRVQLHHQNRLRQSQTGLTLAETQRTPLWNALFVTMPARLPRDGAVGELVKHKVHPVLNDMLSSCIEVVYPSQIAQVRFLCADHPRWFCDINTPSFIKCLIVEAVR